MGALKRIVAISFLASIFLYPYISLSQEIKVRVTGKVIDQLTQKRLAGATIKVLGENPEGTITNELGEFQLALKPGYYAFQISYVGYQPQFLTEYLVTTSKQNYIEVPLQVSTIKLAEAQVKSTYLPIELSKREITVEQTQRYAATFYDPVRLSVSLPAVNATNDQSNNVSVRGTSPAYNQWRLEGVEVASPNHLANAGTFSDRPTLNGGGVNILSAQVLERAKILYGGYDPIYNNALGGIFDNYLRRGDFTKHQHTAQLSLLGIDVATEGPFSKKGKSSYLINYRYSFTGLLADAGVDFGGEEIRFQDLSFNLFFPYKNGTFKVFGTGGISSNDFTGVTDLALAEEVKDLSDIRFDGEVLAIGLKNQHRLSERISLDNTFIYSLNHTDRQQEQRLFLVDNANTIFTDESNKLNKLSFQTKLNYGFSNHSKLQLGYNVVRNAFKIIDRLDIINLNPLIRVSRKEQIDWLVSPFINYKANINSSLIYEIGLTATNYSTANELNIEPRLYLQKYLGPNGTSIYGRYGWYSRSPTPTQQLFTNNLVNVENNQPNGLVKSRNLAVGYITNFKKHNLNLEAFFNSFYDIPTLANNVQNQSAQQGLFSSFNLDNEKIPTSFDLVSKAKVWGVEASIEKRLEKRWYYLLGGALYDSKNEDDFGNLQPSRWDGQFTFNATVGKEIALKTKNNKLRTLSLNGRIIYQGGYRSVPLDTELTIARQENVFTERSLTFKEPNYFRLDLRLSWRVQKENYTRTLSVDIQNAANTTNFAFQTYDLVTNQIERKNQLGIIPLLTYKVEF